METGREMREKRMAGGFSLADVAIEMKVSRNWLFMLERGEKAWSQQTYESYQAALAAIQHK